MTLDDALRDLAATGNALPTDAMRWSLDHWDEAGPRFVALLEAYASKQDRSERTERALFFVIHLLGEKGDAAAFGPLCRLLLDGDASDLILGDAITVSLPQVMVSMFDGDLAALTGVIEAVEAADFVRHGALLATAYLTRIGRVTEAEMRVRLARWLTELRPQAEHVVWAGWVLAIAHLGWVDLAETAKELIRRGFVPPDFMNPADFGAELKQTLDDPERRAGFDRDRIYPFGGAIEELAQWYGFSGEDEPASAEYEIQQPFTNPLRGVGRNDPCPCGSGKKYKKCCLA